MLVDGINSYVLSVRRAVQKLSKPIRCSEAPMKRKTDDCTPLQSSASLISSVPPRHQTCRAESSKAAHFPDQSAQSAATPQRYRSSPSFTPARVPPEASPSLPLKSRHHRCHHTSDLGDLRPSPPPLTPLRILTHSHSATLHSRSPGTPLRSLSSESHKTPGRSSDPSGVRSAHLSPRNLQDCPYHSIRHPAISHIKPQPQAPPSKDIPRSQTHQNRIHIPWHLSALSCIIRLRHSTHIIARHLSKGSQQFLAAIQYCRPRFAPAARQSAST